jgi:hypothetical protein
MRSKIDGRVDDGEVAVGSVENWREVLRRVETQRILVAVQLGCLGRSSRTHCNGRRHVTRAG